MKAAVISVTAIFLAGSASAQTSPAATGAAAQLMQMERDWCKALVTRDPALLEPILAGDYTSVNSRGVMSTKASELADARAGASGFAECTNDNMKVRVFGDAAVITGHNVASGTYQGKPFRNRESYWTDTYVRRNGRWQCVASHSSPAVAPQQ